MATLVPSIGFGGGPGASRLDQANDHFMEDHMKFCRDVGATHVRGDATWTYDNSSKGYSLSFSDSDRFFYWAYKYDLKVLLNIHARSSARFFGGVSSIPRLTNGELPKLKAAALEVCKRYVGPNATFHDGITVALQSGTAMVTGSPANGCDEIETHNEPQQIGDCTELSTSGGLLDPNQLGPEGQHVWPAGGYPERIHLIIRDTANVVHDWYHDAWVVGGSWGGMSHNPSSPSGTISGRRDRTFFDLLVYANQTQGGEPIRANLMPTVLTADLHAGDTVAHLDDTTMFRSAGGTAYVLGQNFTYTGKTLTTLTGVSGITATRPSGSKVHDRNSGYVDEWSGHIYQMAGSDPNFQDAFNVRNLNSIFVDEATGAHRKSFQNLIDSYPCGENTEVGITEGHQAGSKRWNKYQQTYPLPNGTDYKPAAGSNTITVVNWEGPNDVDRDGNQHPASQLDQATTMRHAANRIQQMMSAGLRLRRFIPHVAIDGKIPANQPEPLYWQHVRGHVLLPITNGNYSNSGAVFTRYIDATSTGNPRTGGWGSPQWKEAADAFYDSFANTLSAGPPQPSLTSFPSDPDPDTTPSFAWSNTQTSHIEHRYRIDGGAWTTVSGATGSHTFGVLTTAAHVFDVQAHDTSSGLFSAIRSYGWTIGTAGPQIRPRQRGTHTKYPGITNDENINNPGVPAGVGMLIAITKRGAGAPVVPDEFKLRKAGASGTFLTTSVYEYTIVGNEDWPLVVTNLGVSDHLIVVSLWDDVNADDWVETPVESNSGGVAGTAMTLAGYVEGEPNAQAIALPMSSGGTSWNPVTGWTEAYDEKEVAGSNCAQALLVRDTPPDLDEHVASLSMVTAGPGRWSGFMFGAKGPSYTGVVTIIEEPTDSVSTDARIRVSYPMRGVTFEGNLDGVGFSAMSSTHDISGLSVGDHTFQVRPKFTGGEYGPTSLIEWEVLAETPPPPPPPPTVVRLGCGVTQVSILERGGAGAITWSEVPYTQADWNRVQGDVSEATITVAGADQACLAQAGQIEPWEHEVAIYRDGTLEWVGPINRIVVGEDGTLTINASDIARWLTDRVIYDDLNYPADTDATTIAEAIIESAMSVDNSPGVSVVRANCGHKLRRTLLAADYLNARSELDSLASLFNWAAIKRQIILQPAAATPAIILTEDSFAKHPAVTKDGTPEYSRVTVLGATPIVETANDSTRRARKGLRHETISDGNIATENEALAVAQTTLEEGAPSPTITGGMLSYEAALTIAQLIPGVSLRINFSASLPKVNGSYLLAGVHVTAGGTQEGISIDVVPA